MNEKLKNKYIVISTVKKKPKEYTIEEKIPAYHDVKSWRREKQRSGPDNGDHLIRASDRTPRTSLYWVNDDDVSVHRQAV